MTKEEFLAMSYTGDLIIHCDRNIYSYKGELKNTNLCYDSTVNKFYISKNGTPFGIDNIKPVLHPLSDLTKDEFNFIYEKETDFDIIEQIINIGNESFLFSKFSFKFWMQLIRNHFDICGLIEKGEAIDINTLEINPYK